MKLNILTTWSNHKVENRNLSKMNSVQGRIWEIFHGGRFLSVIKNHIKRRLCGAWKYSLPPPSESYLPLLWGDGGGETFINEAEFTILQGKIINFWIPPCKKWDKIQHPPPGLKKYPSSLGSRSALDWMVFVKLL